MIAYAVVAACGIGVLALGLAALRSQSAHGRRVIAAMGARHAQERAEEDRLLADYRAALGVGA